MGLVNVCLILPSLIPIFFKTSSVLSRRRMNKIIFIIFLLFSPPVSPLNIRFITQPNREIAYSVTQPSQSSGEVAEVTAADGLADGLGAACASSTPLLILNGFGVGQFHQERIVNSLSKSQSHSFSKIYTLDYLGQGDSWPLGVPPTTTLDSIGTSESESDLSYSVETWLEQVHDFITSTINSDADPDRKVVIAGNSLGGYIATILVERYPSLFSTLILFNATPIWGGVLAKSPLSSWDGVLPSPSKFERWIGKTLYDQIRNPSNVNTLMSECYSSPVAHESDGICAKIINAASHNGGHAAFSSILFSPGAVEGSRFYDNLLSSPHHRHIRVLGIYGRDDPWIDGRFSRRLFDSFKSSNLAECRLVELSDVAHCPNHEAATACATLISRFMRATPTLLEQQNEIFIDEAWGGKTTANEITDVKLPTLQKLFVEFLQRVAS